MALDRIQSIVFSDKTSILTLMIRQWTAATKFTAADLPPKVVDQLPPQAIASLGKKRLLPKEALAPMEQEYRFARNYMDNHGIPFLSGWLVATDKLQGITLDLKGSADRFYQAVAHLVANLDTFAQDWADQFPEWRSILLSALPSPEDVRSRYSFTWQAYSIRPSSPSAGIMDADTTESAASRIILDGPKQRLVEAMQVVLDAQKFTRKTLGKLRAAHDYYQHIAWVDPAMDEYARACGVLLRDWDGTDNLQLLQTIARGVITHTEAAVYLLVNNPNYLDKFRLWAAGKVVFDTPLPDEPTESTQIESVDDETESTHEDSAPAPAPEEDPYGLFLF